MNPTPGHVDLSIVIPCLNGAATLGNQLLALLEQVGSPRFEVVVADNGSVDGTRAVVDDFSARGLPVRVVDASRARGINVARNEGVRAARGRWIAMCDADDVVQPGWVEAYLRAFSSGAAAVSGAILRTTPAGEVLSVEDGRYQMLPGTPPHAMGANCGFARQVFDSVGGFDESFTGGSDEIDFFWRVQWQGYTLQPLPDARVAYMLRAGWRKVFRQHLNYGRGHIALLLGHAGRVSIAVPSYYRLTGSLTLGAVRAVTARTAARRRYGIERMGFAVGALLCRLDAHKTAMIREP